MLWPYVLTALLLLAASFRLFTTLRNALPKTYNPHDPHKKPTHLLIVLGSGGHTAEMLSMLHNLNPRHYPLRTYIISSNDTLSIDLASSFEADLAVDHSTTPEHHTEQTITNNNPPPNMAFAAGEWITHTVPRARQIHQSLLTTPISSLRCLLACLRLLRAHPRGWGYPDLILVNGPATSLILVMASVLLRYFSFLKDPFSPTFRLDNRAVYDKARDRRRVKRRREEGQGEMKTIYIESWARVKTPSLSLRIIYWGRLCGRVFVQWEPLAREGWGEFRGDLMR